MQEVKKKKRTALTETIKTAAPALAIVAVGVWTQFSKPHDPVAAPGPVIFSMPAVAVELPDAPDNDAVPEVPALSPASPEATPDADNV